ncbi:hypothetical protein H6503_07015 [Candidatus Woesearchaeota archaeon]|nr:hypothetical protein [Candidatus Woesearchaeota archaeon]
MQSRIYALGTALPLLDFQDWSFIETNLKEYLKSKTDRAEEYFHTLTVPSEDSFSIDEQKDMLRMLDKHKSKRLWRILDDNNASVALEKVKEEFPRFYNDLKAHTKKYAWVYYVYSGPLFKEEDFLELIKSHLDSDPKEKLIEIEEEKARLIAEKERIIAELKPDEFNEELMRISGTVIWAKPRRKDYQSLTYYHLIEGLYKEIARRLGVSRNQILSAPFHWIEKGLRTGKIDVNKLNQIYDFHIAIPKGDKVEILYGDAARRFAKNIECPKEDFDEVDEIKGSVACPGNAEGIVRIINIPADMGKMEKGDILVSAATTPSIVSAMHKASAIITDEGGITCHAAIVSREMQTPCVIGTKFATKILKDGDRVSVDAYSGLVRRIKN